MLLLVSDCHVFQGSHILTDSSLILIVKEIDDISCWICKFFWNEFIALFYPSSQRSFQMLYVEFVWRVRSPTRKENLKLLYIAPSVTTVKATLLALTWPRSLLLWLRLTLGNVWSAKRALYVGSLTMKKKWCSVMYVTVVITLFVWGSMLSLQVAGFVIVVRKTLLYPEEEEEGEKTARRAKKVLKTCCPKLNCTN